MPLALDEIVNNYGLLSGANDTKDFVRNLKILFFPNKPFHPSRIFGGTAKKVLEY
jgi:hypothetical protein